MRNWETEDDRLLSPGCSQCRTSARSRVAANGGRVWRSEAQLITQELEVDGSVISPLVRLHLSTLSLVGDRGARSSAGQNACRARTGFFPFAPACARVEFRQRVYWREPSPQSAL